MSHPNPAAALAEWTARQWATAAVGAVLSVLLIAVPTDLLDTPLFGREVPPTAWAWPSLLVSSLLTGLLLATYVSHSAADGQREAAEAPGHRRGSRGWVGAALTFFAVGCPVCNKVVLLALGYSGAMRWFAPLQPLLQVAGIAVLAWALIARLRSSVACPRPAHRPELLTPTPRREL